VEEIVVSIDIGTSKICTVVGKVSKSGQLEVIGKALSPCIGIKKGVIVDIESTSDSIRSSVKQAESMANLKIGSAYVSIAGMHVSVINNQSWISISNENREITAKDIERVLYAARDIQISEDRQLIDIIPRQYIIDGYDEIMDPIGMVGVKLGVEADIVTGKITSVQNIVKSMKKCNIKIDGLVIGALATGEIALTQDEKDIGVVMIDVGGGITDISVFHKKKLVFYDSIPVGGDHVTNDISIGLKIPYADAEKIKRQYELALTSLIANDQEISVNDVNENRKKQVKVSEVVEIIEARVYEIFSLSENLLQKSGLNSGFYFSVVLTGGGISYVDGCKQLAGEVFELPVRVATYNASGISKPEYAAAAGMIKHVAGVHRIGKTGSEVKIQGKPVTRNNKGLLSKISKIISDFF